MTNKDDRVEAVRELSNDATFEEILDRTTLAAPIRRGEEAADAGQFISHEELKQRVAAPR